MKRFFRLALLAAVAALAVFCASPQQMAKLASMVKTECNPQTLECVGGRIAATYTISFPAKYFLPNAYMKITPELVYENQKEVAPDFWMQGEKIRDNYAKYVLTRNDVIQHRNGIVHMNMPEMMNDGTFLLV